MPIYVYVCRKCGREFEKLTLSMAREGETVCPLCGSREVEHRPALFGLGGALRSGDEPGSACRPATSGG
ncbi:MAG: FmdB family zinc ribbon protein [Chloroflexia bacterium]